MTFKVAHSMVFATALAASLSSAAQSLPGTPVGSAFGPVHLFDGYTLLPGPVVSGDLVLTEVPGAGTTRSNWSDVVRFFTLPVTFNGVSSNLSVAYLMSDFEAGTPSIALVDIASGGTMLPDVLSSNQTFQQEVLTGTGTDADITTYMPGAGTSYLVHSDSPSVEGPEPVVINPGTIVGPGGPNPPPKPFGSLTIVENLNETGFVHSPFTLVTGTFTLTDPDGGFDVFTVTANPAGGSDINLLSDPAEGSPAEVEFFILRGDETYTSGFILSVDPVPEPATFALFGAGLAAMGIAARRRRGKHHTAQP